MRIRHFVGFVSLFVLHRVNGDCWALCFLWSRISCIAFNRGMSDCCSKIGVCSVLFSIQVTYLACSTLLVVRGLGLCAVHAH